MGQSWRNIFFENDGVHPLGQRCAGQNAQRLTCRHNPRERHTRRRAPNLRPKISEGREYSLQGASVTIAVINKRAGGMGLISGRKAFQKPMDEGVKLLNAIQDVYLSDQVTIA